jgi:hypothetical protein
MATKQKSNSKYQKHVSKQQQIILLLKRGKGASLTEIGKATDWQEHSIRGFISGTLKKKLALTVESEKDRTGVRRYKIVADEKRAKYAVEVAAQ